MSGTARGEWGAGHGYTIGRALSAGEPDVTSSRAPDRLARPLANAMDDDDTGWRPEPLPARSSRPSGPPDTWREHWFEHRELLHLAGLTSHVALYFDRDMNRDAKRWLLPYLDDAWRYTKQTYGDFGPDPLLYTVFHRDRHFGGHPGYYTDAMHDHRNTTDCGLQSYREDDESVFGLVTHEIAHVVESVTNGCAGSPAFPIWGDSKWAEYFIHDVYVALGRHRWATHVANLFADGTDDFPRPGTRWFRDWWRPLRGSAGGGPQVMVRFFQLLAMHFPRGADNRYTRDLTWGEYLHFTSGAARGDITELARRAFGWPNEWNAELECARAEFPAITY